MSRKAPSTAATLALARLGIPFAPHTYEHREKAGADRVSGYGLEAAEALGVAPATVFKTLIVDADGALAVAVVPVSTTLDLRAFATELLQKHAKLVDQAVAERRTGYVVGGISPTGQKTRLPMLLDSSAEALAAVFVSGGRRGFDIELSPTDLLRATGGRLASIARA